MKNYNRAIGAYGENLAMDLLIKKGYVIKETNFQSSTGEIDIICKKDNLLVFVEVKSRFNLEYGLPCEAVNFLKYKKILNTCKYYLFKNKIKGYYIRFDVIEVFLNNDFNIKKINHIEDAFRV